MLAICHLFIPCLCILSGSLISQLDHWLLILLAQKLGSYHVRQLCHVLQTVVCVRACARSPLLCGRLISPPPFPVMHYDWPEAAKGQQRKRPWSRDPEPEVQLISRTLRGHIKRLVHSYQSHIGIYIHISHVSQTTTTTVLLFMYSH